MGLVRIAGDRRSTDMQVAQLLSQEARPGDLILLGCQSRYSVGAYLNGQLEPALPCAGQPGDSRTVD